jgi:hypothetical protein
MLTKAPTLKLPRPVHATGNPWKPDNDNPATVPIPSAVIITKIEGPFTERDRKLWTFLVHAAWDDLGVKPLHEIQVGKIDKVFRELEGGHDGAKWIWESAKRLSKTSIEWEAGPDSERLVGVSNLMNAITDKSSRGTGRLTYEIPAILVKVIKQPYRFSRIRLHFMMGLSGKYAVTLYELLEGVINLRNPVIELEISKIRQWLKVPGGKLSRYVDLKRFVLEPAVKQINDNPEGAGFTVDMQPIKDRRSVDRVRFTLTKTEARIEEEKLINKARNETGKELNTPIAISVSFDNPLHLPDSAFNAARKAAPGYDIQYLAREWRESVEKAQIEVKNPNAHFVAFCKSKAEKKPLR